MKTILYVIPCFWSLVVCVEIQTDSGKVVGKQAEYHGLHNNGTYFSFHGIPYATPPVGSLRFHDPVPISPWSGVLDASGGPPTVCPQMEFFDQTKFGQTVGDEDCLFLNIYSPEVPTRGSILRPVIFWIHGGGFLFGSGASKLMGGSGEDLLIEKDMVVVSINYRLGIFGFMALKGSIIQGNMGLKDQLEAIRWIKRNIAAFGGDPSRITIMGESAGGISVHEQVLSPMGKGEDLFHRAISMSGTALMMDKEKFNRYTEDSSRRAFEILCNANLTEYHPGNHDDNHGDHHGHHKDHQNDHMIVSRNLTETCLYSLPALEIAGKLNEGFSKMMNASLEEQMQIAIQYMTFFTPITDDWAQHPFAPQHPVTVLSNHDQKMVPFMSGTTKDEGAMTVVQLWKDMDPKDNKLQRGWEKYGPWKFFEELNPTKISWDHQIYANMIARFYVGENGLNRKNKQGLLDMYTDFMFASPNTETIRLHAKSEPPVYNYRFSYKGSFSLSSLFSMGDKDTMKEDFGVCHGDDLLYIFRLPFPALVTDNDIKAADTFLTLLTSFARYGDPTPGSSQNGDIPKWNPAQNSKRACIYMDINEQPLEKHNMYPTRMEFWRRIYFDNVLRKYGNHHHAVHNDHHGHQNRDHHGDHNDHQEDGHHAYGDHNNHHGDGHHGDNNDHHRDHNDHHGDDNDQHGVHVAHHGDKNDDHGVHNNHHGDKNDHHGDGHHGEHNDDHNEHHRNSHNEHAGHGDQVHHKKKRNQNHSGH